MAARAGDVGVMIILLQDGGDIFVYIAKIVYRLKWDVRMEKFGQSYLEPITFYSAAIVWAILRIYYTITYGIYGLAMLFQHNLSIWVLYTVILMVPIWLLSIYLIIVSIIN